MSRIWLIGGTHESAVLANAIASDQIPCVVTVTTETAQTLYPQDSSCIKTWVGCLDPNTILQFIQEQNINAILDASHPFAQQISQFAIATSTQANIPYLRYERPVYQPREGENQVQLKTGNILHLENFDQLLAGEYLTGKRVMLTLGYRNLARFKAWQERGTLFVRILPSVVSLEAAFNAGFTPDRIIAIRPPISAELEKALWQQWKISLVVTKASGLAGGENIKRTVAHELGIPLIVIDRPPLNYPQKTSNLTTAMQFCHDHLPL